jgi:NDP-sugar pyrophosphorylase family protein
MQLIILAAGKSTRMYPFSDAIPKALMPVGGIPVVRRIVNQWAPHVSGVIICINSKDRVEFEHEFRDMDNITFSQSNAPLGTAGEVINASNLLTYTDNFLVHYGDIITDINVQDFIDGHIQSDLEDKSNTYIGRLLVIKEVLENSIVRFTPDENKFIYSFEEKTISDNYGWGAIAAFRHDIINYLGIGKDFGKDVFPKVIKDGRILVAHISNSKWYDVGNVRNWAIADKAAKEGKI